MSQLNERGARSERGSALWGTGGRGGDRSSVLWGKGGRGAVVSFVLAIALAAPLAASAGGGNGVGNADPSTTWIAPGLLNAGKTSPNAMVPVMITAGSGFEATKKAEHWLEKAGVAGDVVEGRDLSFVNTVSATVRAKLIPKLQSIQGLTVIPDSPAKTTGTVSTTALSSSQLWPYESGNSTMWAGDQTTYAGKLPTIAIVDSGVQPRADFGSRLLASVNLSGLDGNNVDDSGHGTFVAGVAAGAASDLAGAAPTAPIVSLKVMDAQGEARTSDVIAAAQWILDNKDKYNIRVANFSLHSGYSTNFYRDPLDQAVEKLWFAGVTVVAASGNYGISNTQPSGVLYSPGNDPFVITVGAVDLGNSSRNNDDQAAPWSAWGYTPDGFYKPEVSAPGRYMVGPIPAGSYITQVKASNMVGTDRIQLSGTSFAAPVVAGTVAQILARHPNWTPDMIKGDLMRTARAVHIGNPKSAGLGELTASRAAAATYAPNANLGLDGFVKAGLNGAPGLAFDAMSWASNAKANMSWNSMSWASQSWSDMSWTDQSWASMSWTDMSWSSMSWTDMSWTDLSSADISHEDAAEGDDITSTPGYVATPTEVASAATDPDQVSPDAPAVTDGTVTDTTAAATTAVTDTTSAVTSAVTSVLP